jgi:cytosine/adenosine deaminase-related metal-dependent hydrolase
MKSGLTANEFRHDEQLLMPDWLMLASGPVQGHGVVVSHGRFQEVAPAALLKARYPGLPARELARTLMMPGFIDTHHHVTQSFGKSLVFGEPSEIFRRVWVPLEGCLEEEHLYLASKLSALEALRGGFTTVCDAGTRAGGTIDAVARATTDAGIRCVLGLICNDLGGGAREQDPAAIRRRAEDHVARWQDDPLVRPSLAISIPEAATDRMLKWVSDMCAESGCVFQTHVNEHLVAVERSIEQRRRRPIEHLHHIGALGPQALLAHATLVTPEELAMLRDTGAAVSYNPVASAWKGNAVAPAHLMDVLGIRLGLGTDGTRSDAFRLLDHAESAQRFAFGLGVGDSSCGAGWKWLELGTRHGARVLGMDSITGDIAAGKSADFLLVDLDVPEMTPSWDLTWELVRLCNRSQIMAVFVGGRLQLLDGWPVDWDGKALMDQVADVAQRVVAAAPIRKLHDFTADHRRASHAGSRHGAAE